MRNRRYETMGKGQSGFSLVELLIVIALISIMMAIAIPTYMGQLPKRHVNGTARDIAAKLMLARLKAVQNNRSHGVAFTFGSVDSYRVVRLSGGSWLNEGVGSDSYADVNVSSASCANNRTEFYQNGTAGGCGTVSGSPIVVAATDGSFTMQISINENTGNISVVEP